MNDGSHKALAISLSENIIGDTGAREIGFCLSKCYSLTEIFLSFQ